MGGGELSGVAVKVSRKRGSYIEGAGRPVLLRNPEERYHVVIVVSPIEASNS
jgi:hypothetical protein